MNAQLNQAWWVLRIGLGLGPLLAGADKFFNILTNWEMYVSPIVPRLLGVSAHSFMLGVGVIEIIAGFIVAVAPRIGGWIVGLWLCGIIVNLLMIPGYFDIALRDFGLALGAFALARLSVNYSGV